MTSEIITAIVCLVLASSLAGNVQHYLMAQRVTKLEMIWKLACPSCDTKFGRRKTDEVKA